MANIRTLSDYASAPTGAPPPPPRSNRGGVREVRGEGGGSTTLPLFISSGNSEGAEQSEPDGGGRCGWVGCLFSDVHCCSALVLISLVQLAVYLASLCFGLSHEKILAPTTETIILFGANIPELVRKGEVWRLVCPIFLHWDLIHVVVNVAVQVCSCSPVERRYGRKAVTIAYFSIGILANLISAAVFFCGQVKAGASTAVFGLVGIELAELVLQWNRLADSRVAVLHLWLNIFCIVLSCFGRHGDFVGHLAGLYLGFGAGLYLNRNSDSKPAWFDRSLAITKVLVCMATVASIVFVWGVPRCQ